MNTNKYIVKCNSQCNIIEIYLKKCEKININKTKYK